MSSGYFNFSNFRRIVRTSAFRLTGFYCLVFIVSSLAVTGFACWFITNAMTDQIDDMIKNELVDVQTDAGHGATEEMREAVVKNVSLHSPGLLYLFEDSQGHFLAGNLQPFTPRIGFFEVSQVADGGNGAIDTLRIVGRGMTVANGNFLFIGVSNLGVSKTRDAIIWLFMWSTLFTGIVAVISGYVLSVKFLGRIEAISQSSRNIVLGNLSERIEIRGTGDELDHLSVSLNGMLERIQDLLEGLEQVANEIAHDLRTPMSRLRYRLEAWRDQEATTEKRNRLNSTLDDVDEILGTFESLLGIARIESGASRSGFGDVDLTANLQQLVTDFRFVGEDSLHFIFSSVDPGLVVHGDRHLINQLLYNLLENALNHTPTGTTIWVTATRAASNSGNKVRIVVADSGPGVPREKLGKITQRFFRITDDGPVRGTGLGLSLVKAIVKAHGGELKFESNTPGLRCVVVLPATQVFARELTHPQANATV